MTVHYGVGGENSFYQLGVGPRVDKISPVQITFTGGERIDGGQVHSVALKDDGTVWIWGNNYERGLGGFGNSFSTPYQTNISNVVAIDTYFNHSVLLKNDGTLWAFGLNSDGQLGIGDFSLHTGAVQVSSLSGVTSCVTATRHSLALKNDGTVWSFGSNDMGQLGVNDGTIKSNIPRAVVNLDNVFAIAAGHMQSAAIKSDGTVWMWGYNAHGQLGQSSTGTYPYPVQIANFNLKT